MFEILVKHVYSNTDNQIDFDHKSDVLPETVNNKIVDNLVIAKLNTELNEIDDYFKGMPNIRI